MAKAHSSVEIAAPAATKTFGRSWVGTSFNREMCGRKEIHDFARKNVIWRFMFGVGELGNWHGNYCSC